MSRIRTETSGAALDDIIRLQLRKPRKWNWELSTSKSSPHIPLPIIQLFDDKKNLLVETKTHDRRSWHVSDYRNARPNYTFSEKPSENSGYRTQVNYLKKQPSISAADSGKHTLNTADKIRIKEHLLRKTKSDAYARPRSKNVNVNSFSSRRSNDSYRKPLYTNTTPLYEEETCTTFRSRHSKERHAESTITEPNYNRYTLRSCSAGTLLINEDADKLEGKRRRRRKTPQLRRNSSSSDTEQQPKNKEKETISHPVKTARSIVRRCTDLSSLSDVRKRYEKQKCNSFADFQSSAPKLGYKPSDLEYAVVENTKLTCQNSDTSKCSDEDSITMGANFSRHSSKGMSGRRCQSISNICNSKDHFLDPSGREVDAAYKFCNSLPSPNGTAYNNNYEHKPLAKKTSLQHTLSAHVIGPEHHPNDCHPLQWKFTDTQTCDQGYGSERSPEEEIPPPIPTHDYECEHTIDFCYSSYPFITPENTFEVELVKGSRGLGLSVCGGVDSDGSWPGLLRIKRLFPHQPAAVSGVLSVGDLLLEANGVSLTGLSNYEALEVLRMTPNKVVLLVCRPPPEVLSTMSPVSDIPPPPPRRSSSPQRCSSKMSEDAYETEFEIILNKIHGSLGFTLCKEEEGMVGHYVRALVREPAISDGRIQPGDKIVAVNGIAISSMSHEQAVQFLRQCDIEVLLRLYREMDRTPVDLSPTDITPNSSFRPKPNLRQEAVDMLSDLAARKLCPPSPCDSLRHFRNDPGTSNFESLCSDIDDDKAVRPCFLDLYNPNQTPVAVRKSKFNLSLAHNAYELNNLDPEMLDAPNLNYECEPSKMDLGDYPEEPLSMPPLSTTNKSGNFSHKKPTYQSAHPQVDVSTCSTSTQLLPPPPPPPPPPSTTAAAAAGGSADGMLNDSVLVPPTTGGDVVTKACSVCGSVDVVDGSGAEGETPPVLSDDENLTQGSGIVFSAERDLLENDAHILNIELNRGWNSRLGFSLQEMEGCTCVSAVYPDSVAAKDGRLRPGDCVLRVNDEMVENMRTSDVIDLLRIIRGPVCITVLRRITRLD